MNISANIKDQFKAFLNSGGIPVLEYELLNGDYLIVNIDVGSNGVIFEFDSMDLLTYFDGAVTDDGYNYLMPFDEYLPDNLDYYLQEIGNNITEGFLIPNNLYL